MIGYGFCDTGLEVHVSICIFVRFVMPMLILPFTKWVFKESSICPGNIVLSKGDNAKGGEGVWLNFIIHHFLCGNTIYRCLRHLVNYGLHMSNALSFIKGDMFIGIISYHCIQSWLSFDIVNAVQYMDAGFSSLLGMLMTNKICHLVL